VSPRLATAKPLTAYGLVSGKRIKKKATTWSPFSSDLCFFSYRSAFALKLT
jgi:hypothetical protein